MRTIKLFILLICFGSSTSLFAQFSFDISGNQGCAPFAVTCFNASGGVIYDWYWGDGSPGTFNDPNPSHTYTTGGNFWITMYAYDGMYNYLGQKDTMVSVTGPPQNIYMSNYTACPGDAVNLNVYMQTATSWDWDFDDGTTDSGTDYVYHAWSSDGEYHPTVTITTSDCGVFVVQDTITITSGLTNFTYNPYFYVSDDTVCPNSEVYGQVQEGYSNYAWDFGDGNTGNTAQEQWQYASVGDYTVTLTITNGCGIDTVMTDMVNVNSSTPPQNPYYQAPDTVCPGENFNAWAWANDAASVVYDMGDGTIINNNNAYHSYPTSGSYNTTATITNECGNQVVLNQTIVVDPNAQVQNPYLYISNTVVCPGDEIHFDSNYEYDFYIDYGDGNGSSTYGYHSYNSPGIYVVTATIQNICGNSVVITDTVDVQDNLPVPQVYAWAWPDPACPGTEIDFDADWGYSSYLWDFGDGVTSTNQNADHIYNAPGTYNASVIITNGCGNTGTAYVTVNVVPNLPISQYVDLQMSNDTVCPGNGIFFGENDGDSEYSYLWDFGDGNTSTLSGISHSYASVGTYPIELTITNTCGSDTTLYDTVVVSNSYVPTANDYQVFAQEEGCIGDDLYFVVAPANAGTISWDFGDGNSTNTVQEILVQGTTAMDAAFHSYTSTGTYWATWTITNACGNSISDSILITVGGPGDNMQVDATFWWDESQTACQGQPVEFTGVGASTFIWDFGDGTGQLVTNGQLQPVYHTFADPGQYTVTLQAINGCGVSDISDENIFIPQSQMEITTNTVTQSNCGENNGMAVASVSGGMAPYEFSWSNGDTGVIADSLQSGIYVLTVTDNNGCSNEGIATVSDVEGVTILIDNVVDVDCYGASNGSISVSLLGGQPPYTILWSNGDQTEDIFGLQAGPYEIFVTDANGCFSVQSIEVSQPAKSNVSVITTPAQCGFTDGTATASVNNGTPPYNYIWPNTGGPSNTTGGLAPGVYNLLVIDGNTCLLEKQFQVNETGGPIIIKDSTVTGTCNGTLSSIYISTIGGQQPFTYNWSDASTNQDLTGVLPGDYTVQITGSNGCSSFASFNIKETQPDQTSICLVDVDTLTQTNRIVWDPITGAGISHYNIYKESSQAGLYYWIGSSDADSISQFTDSLSDPSIRSWKYKVAAVDDCGNEAEWSDPHKTIHLTTNMGIGGEVNLIWDHYKGFSYPTYYVERHHPSTGWMILDSLPSNLISYTDQTPPSDSSLTYRIYVVPPGTCTAFKAQDYNSSRSNNEAVNMPEPDDSGLENENFELTIYPNPTNGIVQIRYEGLISEVRIFDMSGQLIYTSNATSSIHTIDMAVYERGVYTIQLVTNEGLINGKIIRD